MVVAYRLNAAVRVLEGENKRIDDANRAYQQQLAAVARPDGAEEQARLHNYVKPDEHVYIIAAPSASPSPYPSPSAGYHQEVAAERTSGGFWSDLWGALTSFLGH
jgi:hypothetical protein